MKPEARPATRSSDQPVEVRLPRHRGLAMRCAGGRQDGGWATGPNNRSSARCSARCTGPSSGAATSAAIAARVMGRMDDLADDWQGVDASPGRRAARGLGPPRPDRGTGGHDRARTTTQLRAKPQRGGGPRRPSHANPRSWQRRMTPSSGPSEPVVPKTRSHGRRELRARPWRRSLGSTGVPVNPSAVT